jgi:hypothetical protein
LQFKFFLTALRLNTPDISLVRVDINLTSFVARIIT